MHTARSRISTARAFRRERSALLKQLAAVWSAVRASNFSNPSVPSSLQLFGCDTDLCAALKVQGSMTWQAQGVLVHGCQTSPVPVGGPDDMPLQHVSRAAHALGCALHSAGEHPAPSALADIERATACCSTQEGGVAYLSPDAPALLHLPAHGDPGGAETAPQPVLIMAAIIDRTVQRGASLNRAHALGIPAARLPFSSQGATPLDPLCGASTPAEPSHRSVVLNLEHVARSCLAAAAGGGTHSAWAAAWKANIPSRILQRGRPQQRPSL